MGTSTTLHARHLSGSRELAGQQVTPPGPAASDRSCRASSGGPSARASRTARGTRTQVRPSRPYPSPGGRPAARRAGTPAPGPCRSPRGRSARSPGAESREGPRRSSSWPWKKSSGVFLRMKTSGFQERCASVIASLRSRRLFIHSRLGHGGEQVTVAHCRGSPGKRGTGQGTRPAARGADRENERATHRDGLGRHGPEARRVVAVSRVGLYGILRPRQCDDTGSRATEWTTASCVLGSTSIHQCLVAARTSSSSGIPAACSLP